MGISVIDIICGSRLINSIQSGNETQSFEIGDKVTSTPESRYKIFGRFITGVYKDNGFFYYLVNVGGSIMTFRQKDLKLAE